MGNNCFGHVFQYITWGESHGSAVGVVIDGCPAGLSLSEEEIKSALEKRRPGYVPYTSPRKEEDIPEILSGLFEGKTTGAPLSVMVRNKDVDSTPYHQMKALCRPGHANFCYATKYGIYDYRGGGRASARETVGRVIAGAVAKKLVEQEGIAVSAQIQEIGGESDYQEKLAQAFEAGDSLGGVIGVKVRNVPIGLGEPIYAKVEALLASAMLSLPATKGFEMGKGFEAARMQGSSHNDPFIQQDGEIQTASNHSGGSLGGITNGMPLTFRVAFKPTSSIRVPQKTVTLKGEESVLTLPKGAKHDPCVVFRALPVVEAMTHLVLADLILLNRLARR